ncbi:fibroblast growth factor receptor-like [Hydra vulgaris]|uniref:Fibroblast growth factor receptor-like n=1 Tax=Hydra vulgaris TaxID=6087 RepID=A0ABM4CS93_HYDVU
MCSSNLEKQCGTPYPTLSNRKLLSFLKANCRMDRPENCSSIVHDIMLNCWSKDPLLRPTFSELRNKIEQIISQGGRYLSFDTNEESPYYNVPSFNSVRNRNEIMLNCRNKDPLLRTTFSELRNKIEQIILQGGRNLSFHINEESPYCNVPSFNSV